MAVSYRFHAYSPQRKDLGRRLRVKERQTLAEPEPSARPAEPLQYGRRFAETEQRGQDRSLEAPEAHRAQAFSAPIGALPATEEPMNPQDALSPDAARSGARGDTGGETKEGMDRVVAEAMEQVGVMTSAIRDLGESSLRLARFPWDAARALRLRRKGR